MSPVEARLAHADGQRTTGEIHGDVWFDPGQRCSGYIAASLQQHTQMQVR
jgi:hypothetical protein